MHISSSKSGGEAERAAASMQLQGRKWVAPSKQMWPQKWCHDSTRHGRMLSQFPIQTICPHTHTHTHTHTESSLLHAGYATREKNSSSCRWRSWCLASCEDDEDSVTGMKATAKTSRIPCLSPSVSAATIQRSHFKGLQFAYHLGVGKALICSIYSCSLMPFSST